MGRSAKPGPRPHPAPGRKSGRGLPHVQDASRLREPLGTPSGLGLRQSSGAVAAGVGWDDQRNLVLGLIPLRGGKVVEDYRTSKTLRDYESRWELRQVL